MTDTCDRNRSLLKSRLPSLHLFAQSADDARTYADLEFIEKYKESRREQLDTAIESISPTATVSASAVPASPARHVEGLEYLRNRLLDLASAAGSNLILFNSPANEGLALEFIQQFAQCVNRDHKILIIDCDLQARRHPTNQEVESQKPGLSEYVSGKKGLEEIVLRTASPNLFSIASGEAVANPMRALMSNRFLQLMDLLKSQFDLILLNSPPYRQGIDTFLLAKFLRPILVLALKGDQNNWPSVADIRKELAVLDLKILGLLDNR